MIVSYGSFYVILGSIIVEMGTILIIFSKPIEDKIVKASMWAL